MRENLNNNDECQDEINIVENIDEIPKENKCNLKRDNSTVNYYCDPVLNDNNSYVNANLEFDNFVYKNFNSLDDTNRSIVNSPKL